MAAGNDSLPPAVSDKIYTIQQVEQQKLDLSGKPVRIEIGSLLGDGKSHLPDGSLRYIAEDASKGTMPFGQVAFPTEGLRNGALPDDLKKSPAAFYFRVHVVARFQCSRALHCGRQTGLQSQTAKRSIPGKFQCVLGLIQRILRQQ